MGKEKFVDNNLVNIRGRLMEETNEKASSKEVNTSKKDNSARSRGSSSIQDKEWKKAIFKRWDEYKALRRDVIIKINDTLMTIPDENALAEKKISELKQAGVKLRQVLSAIEELDDSGWDRHNLTSELTKAMRKVENARMDCILLSSKLSDKKVHSSPQSITPSANSIIHDIASLSFSQCFKVGLGLFFPLIIGIIVGSLIVSLFYYISVH